MAHWMCIFFLPILLNKLSLESNDISPLAETEAVFLGIEVELAIHLYSGIETRTVTP
jgi:hypothetical protein